MRTSQNANQYEVLSPWAEVDFKPLRGISARLNGLNGKIFGLFTNSKEAAPLIISTVEKKLKAQFPDAKLVWYVPAERTRFDTMQLSHVANKPVFLEWLKGVDAVVGAIGD
jgi:hypothetical protein